MRVARSASDTRERRAAQIVTDAGLQVEGRRRRDRGEGAAELRHRAERVRGAQDEERGCAEAREVRDAELSRASGRVEGIAEQEECPRHGGILGSEEARLTTTVGVAPEIDALRTDATDRPHGGPEPRTVPSRPGWRRWAVRARLPERQVAAEHHEASVGEHLGEGDQERAVRGCAGAMGEDETFLGDARGCVERPAHCRLFAGLPVERDARRTSGIRRAHGRMPGRGLDVAQARHGGQGGGGRLLRRCGHADPGA
jgi:hypothetical protein